MFSQGATLANLGHKSDALGSQKRAFGLLLGTFGAPWGVFGPTLGTKCPHRDCTVTAHMHCGALQSKKVPPGLPKWVSAAVAVHPVALR